MNIDRNDSWNDDNDFLSGALQGAADEMPGGEVDDLHISFGVVRDRVRRRRAVKIGGLAGVSLVLVGGIAFGATRTPLLESDAPVLPGSSHSAFLTPVPDDSASPSTIHLPNPSPGPSAARETIEAGYTPPWLEGLGAGLECGMPVADLTTTAAGWSVASAGDIYSEVANYGPVSSPTLGMAATVQRGDGSLDLAPTLVWSQDGVVVDLGLNVFEGAAPQTEPLLGSGGGAVEAQDGLRSTCIPTETETGTTFGTLPDGDYEVRVVAFPEVTSGQWATAVSEPVEVRLDGTFDGTGVLSPVGTRGGTATGEPLAPNADEMTRFVLDRSTDWVLALHEQSNYSTTDPAQVTAQCESVNTGDEVPFEVVVPSTQDVIGAGSVQCDATQQFTAIEVPDVGGEILDIRLGDVPDGVVRLEAILAPSGDGEPEADCSASDLTIEYDPSRSPSDGASATAAAIVVAAQDCDFDRMEQLATQYPTELLVPAEPAEQVFALPEGDAQHYRTLVALLAGTGGAFDGGDTGNKTVVWPRVATEEFRDSNEAWEEVVAAGLLTQEQADAQRADETFGYTGMRIAIDESGTWRYYAPTP